MHGGPWAGGPGKERMLPLYKDRKAGIEIYYRQSRHVPSHVHETVELIYVASGTLELGIGNETYHMETGDFGLIFPNIVHHYDVTDENPGKSLNIIADAELAGTYYPTLQKYCPVNPVIKADDLHPDVFYAIQSIPEESENADEYVIRQAFLQIVIARCLQTMKLVDKSAAVNNDLTYQTVVGVFVDLGVFQQMLCQLKGGTHVFAQSSQTDVDVVAGFAQPEVAAQLIEFLLQF